MKKTIHPADLRGKADFGWLKLGSKRKESENVLSNWFRLYLASDLDENR